MTSSLQISRNTANLSFQNNKISDYTKYKKDSFINVKDSFQADFKKKSKVKEEPTQTPKPLNNILKKESRHSNKYIKSSTYKPKNNANYVTRKFIDYNDYYKDYDYSNSLVGAKFKQYPNSVVDRIQQFCENANEQNKKQPKILDPVKETFHKAYYCDKSFQNDIELPVVSYISKQSNSQMTSIMPSKFKSTNLNSIRENNFLEFDENDNYNYSQQFKDDEYNQNYNYNYDTTLLDQNDAFMTQKQHKAEISDNIDIGLFKSEVPLDYGTLTKVCSLINKYSKSKGEVDYILDRNDKLYHKLAHNNIDANTINKLYDKRHNTSLSDSRRELREKALLKNQKMKNYGKEQNYNMKLTTAKRHFKGFMIENLTKDADEDYEFHLY